MDDSGNALKSAEEAYQLASEDPKAGSRISIYHDLISKCHEQLGDIMSAHREAVAAFDKCKDSRYNQDLQERITMLKGKYNLE